MDKAADNNGVFCCEGMKALQGDYACDSIFTPLIGDSFSSREIFFCPSCGKGLGNNPALDRLFDQLIKTKSDNPSACCKIMELRIDPESEEPDYFQLYYQPFSRRFFFSQSMQWREGDPEGTFYKEWDFYYCPWCGIRLSLPLLKEWLEIVKQKFGVEKQLPLNKMLALVPEEFRTEEWWRNRGL